MKKFLLTTILILVCSFLLLTATAYALTAEEAEIIYRANNCKMVSQAEEQICFNCDPTPAPECAVPIDVHVTVHWKPEWDEAVVEPEPEPEPPSCTPTWCSAPLIPCDQTPITGVDSCGNICTKPSAEWPNCIAN